MKRLFILILVYFAMITLAIAKDTTYKVYRAGEPVIPTYTAKPNTNGGYNVYRPGEPVTPKYIVKPDGDGGYKVYPAGKPVVPIKTIKPTD